MRSPPVMTGTTLPDRPRRQTAFLRDELLSGALSGGVDMDLMLDRLFDTLSEQRP